MLVAGWPQPAVAAYASYMEQLTVYSTFALGIGEGKKRALSIPQGCVISMTVLALLDTAWINMVRDAYTTAVPVCLADDMKVLNCEDEEVTDPETLIEQH
eukprot:1506711-Alexandrium_andersonii.AAC.1